jgi:hypothetical protein
MPNWSDDELSRVGAANELRIATPRGDGSPRSAVPIWVVRVGDDLFIRAYRGRSGSWFRQALASGTVLIRAGGVERWVALQEADPEIAVSIDAAYRQKYGRGTYVDAMVTPDATAATFRLVPAE